MPDADKKASSAPPPDFGPAADRTAILRDLGMSNQAVQAQYDSTWKALVTADYISVNPDGQVRNAVELAKDVKAGALTLLPPLGKVSVRVFGTAAIVTSKTLPEHAHPPRGTERVTQIDEKQHGGWLRAAAIVTGVSDE